MRLCRGLCTAIHDQMETIRVIIVEEQPLFREGIRATLEQMGDCVIVGATVVLLDELPDENVGSGGTVKLAVVAGVLVGGTGAVVVAV